MANRHKTEPGKTDKQKKDRQRWTKNILNKQNTLPNTSGQREKDKKQ